MIYILSPVGEATGGTELLQQFCAELRKQGAEACMYYEKEYKGSAVEGKFSHYENPYVYKIEDSARHVLVVPEVRTEVCDRYAQVEKVVWWLSVDNYKSAVPRLRAHDASNLRKLLRFFKHLPQGLKEKRLFANIDHLAQSQYAVDYLRSIGIEEQRIHKLSDYIDEEFCMPVNAPGQKRDDTILYNPKKGWYFTKRLMDENPGYDWVALSGFTMEEMIERMQTAKVYIDFGNHPGKDRLPREAAACGCCIITGKAGSARNNVDVPIPGIYKFDDNADIGEIMALVDECLKSYEERISDFADYRNTITEERFVFSQEVSAFLDRISN